jgi:uncharacterized membrane protein
MKVSAVGRGLIVRNKSAGSSFIIVFACFCMFLQVMVIMFINVYYYFSTILDKKSELPIQLGDGSKLDNS